MPSDLQSRTPKHAWLEDEQAKRACESSLLEFTKQGWASAGIPEAYQHNWHIECICDHLEAVSNREILRVIFNIPPGHYKSLGAQVFWPAWTWAQDPLGHAVPGFTGSVMQDTWRGPGVRFACISHGFDLAVDFSVRCRQLIESDWYHDRWGERVSFRKDANQQSRYINEAGGQRFAGIKKGVTGKDIDVLIWDDPLDSSDADSETERAGAIKFISEDVPGRLRSGDAAIVLVMQRLHSRDPSGYILSRMLDAAYVNVVAEDERQRWVHVCLPAEFEKKHPHPMQTPVLRTIKKLEDGSFMREPWTDLRTKEGEVLWESRFPLKVLRSKQIAMTPYAIAGQYQQRPMGREGGKFKRAWFTEDKFMDLHEVPSGTRWVRHWDLAGTAASGADYTVGLKLGLMPNKCYVVSSVIRTQSEGHDVRDLIQGTAGLDGYECDISLPKDPGQAGKVQAADFVRALAGYIVVTERELGPKPKRADPVAAQASHGNLYLVRATWNEAFLEELCLFPAAPNDDQVDALSAAFSRFVMEEGEFSAGGLGGLN